MRQQENKKENFRENPTKLTWIPKVYNYAERTGNLKAEAVGVVSGEKHFPVFEERMVFKPLTKSKPFSTPLFAWCRSILVLGDRYLFCPGTFVSACLLQRI